MSCLLTPGSPRTGLSSTAQRHGHAAHCRSPHLVEENALAADFRARARAIRLLDEAYPSPPRLRYLISR